MGKPKKKKTASGQAANFVTRSQALRKLQISLQGFRRLCIFKGIYPREPRSRKKASKTSTPSTTFYYTKDIQYLLHEPVLQKLREQKTFQKKLSKSIGRGDYTEAARLEKTSKPLVKLDHIVRERYPTFIDALRDLDDPLCMLFLFANLPATNTVPSKIITKCERLCLEFQNYVIRTHSLRKSFLSIKGIYYQATIQGQDIMWLVPYKFTPSISRDIDFRIMGTFVEFYTTLLGFVNYRLYTSIDLVYPPRLDTKSEEHGGELRSMILEASNGGLLQNTENGLEKVALEDSDRANTIADRAANLPSISDLKPSAAEAEVDALYDSKDAEEDVPEAAIDKFQESTDPEADNLAQPQFASSDAPAKLFEPFTFFLSRETPRQPLEFIIRSFGCEKIGWDAILGDGAFTNDESDPRITHQIVDRPVATPQSILRPIADEGSEAATETVAIKASTHMNRIYVQPQWVWDSINACALMQHDLYAPGAELPPHLSPWVKTSKGQYDPTVPLAEQEEEGEAELAALEADGTGESEEEANGLQSSAEADSESEPGLAENGMHVAGSDDEDEGSSELETFEQESWDGFTSNEDQQDSDDEESALQRELEAEAASASANANGTRRTSSKVQGKAKPTDIRTELSKKKAAETEDLERRLTMMSRKKRKLYQKMVRSNKREEAEAQNLRAKRRRLEKNAAQ